MSITALLPLVSRSARVVDQIIDSDIARADARTDALSRQTVSIIACATVVSGRS
ncbi:hypothetical protein [Affinibrenneria salicis]|uniref:hypothetical protein n=1 Tax=Affinibrenneria salicis TaxID=2590031 RepID=UPI00168B241D|nr:hypothetical protein [Affinibrenneria salicis]